MKTIYQTGITQNGTPLIGGIWRAYHQHGIPVETSIGIVKEKNLGNIDWLEAMADASTDDNLPALMQQIEEAVSNNLISKEEVESMKVKFSLMMAISDCKSIIEEKKCFTNKNQ